MLSVNQITERLADLSFAEAEERLIQFNSWERPTALVLVMCRAPTAADRLRVFLDWGCVCDAPWRERSNIAEFLRRALTEVALADFLGPAARSFYDALPEVVPVWRGCEQGRERGLSWTTDRATAEGFAEGKRTVNKTPTLARAEIPKRHILAVFVERQESEIVLDPRHLCRLSGCKFASHPAPTVP